MICVCIRRGKWLWGSGDSLWIWFGRVHWFFKGTRWLRYQCVLNVRYVPCDKINKQRAFNLNRKLGEKRLFCSVYQCPLSYFTPSIRQPKTKRPTEQPISKSPCTQQWKLYNNSLILVLAMNKHEWNHFTKAKTEGRLEEWSTCGGSQSIDILRQR